MTLARNGNLEMALKLFGTVASWLDFLMMGCTTTCLKQEGIEPLTRQLFMILQRACSNTVQRTHSQLSV